MPPLRKPHRVAFLVPELVLEGPDAPFASEVGLLLWVACIEVCQRHPGLAVFDAESTPLESLDGHFAPRHARPGAAPVDGFYGPTRRDELVWLELALPRPGAVRLHTRGRDGKQETFDALGRNVGDQIQQVLERWLAARGLGPPPRRFESAEASELLAAVRVLAPTLTEQARVFVALEQAGATLTADAGAPERTAETRRGADEQDGAPEAAAGGVGNGVSPGGAWAPRRLGRALAGRLAASHKLAALRLLELALREDLSEQVLAIDPEQPQALFRRFLASAPRGRDPAVLRRILAIAPCWARPYAELADGERAWASAAAPSELEVMAGAGIAALCRPNQLDVLETAADRLDECGRVDEGIRLLERAVALHGTAAADLALQSVLRGADRPGAWLAQAQRSAQLHGCPMDPRLPWYPDQIQIDLQLAEALLAVGRLDEAIALRANRLEGREASWPRHARILTRWRSDPRLFARCVAREAALRGDPARAIEGYALVAPEDALDVAALLDALVATGREDEVALAWAQYGIGREVTAPVARLAAARGLLAAGQWRRGVEELWRLELTEPGRDDHAAIARACMLMSCAPLAELEAALAERVAIGAHTLVRRMARDIADFVPGAAQSSIVLRALGRSTPSELDVASLAGFSPRTPSRRAIDELFAEAAAPDGDAAGARARADRLVNRWLEVVFTEAADDAPGALAQAAAYVAAHALGRYLAATTAAPSPIAGGYRTVAAEALALVHRHRAALGDREVHALLRVIDPLLRRADRWLASQWLGAVERSCAIDERARGDVAGFAREHPTVAARLLGPEETAVLGASVARLHRERPDGWASAVAAQAGRLAAHTGSVGADEWADAVVALCAARELDLDDALDQLHTACYLSEGLSAGPAVHAARLLLDAGRAPGAFAVLCSGLPASDDDAWRAAQLAALTDAWTRSQLDVPLAFDAIATQLFEALQAGDAARAEKLGRLAVAIEPRNPEAHRNLGIALAQLRRVPDALVHLVRASAEQATHTLGALLAEAGALADAMAVFAYASRWYTRAQEWLDYAGVAYAAMDSARAVRAFALAHQLDPGACGSGHLSAYAAALAEIGAFADSEAIARELLARAGDDLGWRTTAWDHLAIALLGQARLEEALEFAHQAVDHNPEPARAAAFAATLARVEARDRPTLAPAAPASTRDAAFLQLDAGEFASAAALSRAPSWCARRVALIAARFRYSSENELEVAPRALVAATSALEASAGIGERDAMIAREQALAIREQAYFAREPAVRLGDRPARSSLEGPLHARRAPAQAAPAKFVDRVVVPGGRIERISDYVALIRDLATLAPHEALAQFELDDAAYLEVGRAWAAAVAADPAVADAIAAGLAKR